MYSESIKTSFTQINLIETPCARSYAVHALALRPIPSFLFCSLCTAMTRIRSIEYFRVKPRWLFVLIKDDAGGYGWGEATLEGHSLAVEGALDDMIVRLIGYEAESVSSSV